MFILICNFFKFQIKFTLELPDLTKDIVEELLRYIYTDHVDNLDALAPQLVSLSERFHLKGMKIIV